MFPSHDPENANKADIEAIKYAAKGAQSIADMYLDRLERYLCDKNIDEYDNAQTNDYDVDPRNVDTVGGWWLGGTETSPRSRSGGSGGNYIELE